MPVWETMGPLPVPGETGDPDPRPMRAQAIWSQVEQTLPLLPAMHEVEPHLVHEDVELQGVDFSGYVPEWYGRPYRWRDYYYAHDQTPHYAYAKRVLKAMTWLRGPNRWVLKSPPHMENFGPISRVYSDAVTVVIHRDPVAVLQSAVTMLTYGERLRRDRIEHMLRACVNDRALLPADRSTRCSMTIWAIRKASPPKCSTWRNRPRPMRPRLRSTPISRPIPAVATAGCPTTSKAISASGSVKCARVSNSITTAIR